MLAAFVIVRNNNIHVYQILSSQGRARLGTEVPTGEEMPVKHLPDVWHLTPFERFTACKAIGV